ncbi:MAG: hypothetical protein GF335_03720 [Candidatus Moranbacteria bacterium]|nr:hypothetical protein [Candidatus Moranbacteria bacterium]
MSKKKKYIVLITAGLILIALGFSYQLLDLAGNLISLVFINSGVIIIVIAVLNFNHLGAGVSQDEMTRKISARALSYSWLLTFALLNILFWVDYLEILKLQTQTFLTIAIFVMLFSAVIFKKLIFNIRKYE